MPYCCTKYFVDKNKKTETESEEEKLNFRATCNPVVDRADKPKNIAMYEVVYNQSRISASIDMLNNPTIKPDKQIHF